jgi:DNA-binding transcriptional LysR family regulator
MDYETDLKEISDIMKDYSNVTLDADEDDRFAADMRRLNIDLIVKSLDKPNNEYSGFMEGNDSLLIFIRKSHSILKAEKRIIYDFASRPRNFGGDSITNAAYERMQLNDRWYFSTVGFD